MKKKTITDSCERHGLDFKHQGRRQYVIAATINQKRHVWECSSLRECKEAIFQAQCLKKWEEQLAA